MTQTDPAPEILDPELIAELDAANAEADDPATIWVSGEDLLRQLREKRQEKPVGLIDLDGSVADFDAAMAAQLEALRGPGEDATLDETAYEDVPHIRARRRLIKSQPGFWRGLAPLKLGFDVVDIMRDTGFALNVLSKGPVRVPAAWMEKVEWCSRHLPDAKITLTEDKGLQYGKVLLDDWPSYIAAWLAHRPRGFVIAVAQRWNVDIERQFPGRVLRYDGSNRTDVRYKLQAIRDAHDHALQLAHRS